jgi:hypothetical protein
MPNAHDSLRLDSNSISFVILHLVVISNITCAITNTSLAIIQQTDETRDPEIFLIITGDNSW